jgi:hypothetical protein
MISDSGGEMCQKKTKEIVAFVYGVGLLGLSCSLVLVSGAIAQKQLNG